MNDRDGLYLLNQWVALPTGIAVTLQGNDLTKPATLQASYTNEFQLPDSLLIRGLLTNSEQLDSAELIPYQTLPAYIIISGETIFTGVAELSTFSNGWQVTLYEEKRDLFTRLDRSIRTTDLTVYNHVRSLDIINSCTGATDGYCYPCIDYGLLSGNVIPLDVLFPAIYVHTLIRQMLHEEGYRLVGDLPDDALFSRLVIPFSEDEGKANDQQWSDDRYARVTQDRPEEDFDTDAFGAATAFDRIQPYNMDNLPLQGIKQGKYKPFNTGTYSYVCPDNMRVIVDATQIFRVRCNTGSVECILTVEKNGQEAGREYFSTGSYYNSLMLRPDTLHLYVKVPCVKGDQLRIRLVIRRQTKIGNYAVKLLNSPDSSYVSFTPDLTLQTGDVWQMARNLPDMTGTTLMKAVAQIFCGTWAVSHARRSVEFVGLSDTIDNTENAVDWSNRIDTSLEPSWSPRIDPYAQANYLRWQETDVTKLAGITLGTAQQTPGINHAPVYNTLGYGDGLINVPANTLDVATDLFQLPFAASTNSVAQIAGYGNPVRIETRTVSGGQIQNNAASPRLVLVNPATPIAIDTTLLGPDGLTTIHKTANLPSCWFGARPIPALVPNLSFCLCFSPVAGLTSEMCLIDRHYTGLKRVLRRMRVLSMPMRLLPADVSQLDFGVPIRLQRVQAGSLTISDGYYYLNTVPEYQDGKVVNVVLVGY